MKKQVCLLANTLCAIGGIETFVYNWCNLMKDTYDIVVAVTNIATPQYSRLKKIVKVVYNTTPIECDTLIVMHIGTKEIPSNIKYKTKIQMIHGCKCLAYSDVPNADLIVPVSETARISYGNELENKQVKSILNPAIKGQQKKILKLVSATRLTKEKGGDRIIKLARLLNENNIPFIWYVFSSKSLKNKREIPNGIVELPPTLDISSWIKECDYLVQLSDTESFCYSLVESLQLGVPVITTPLDVLDEIGFKDGVNGYAVPFDMSNIDINKIYNSNLKFEYNYDNNKIYKQWCDVLGQPKPFIPYKEELMKIKIIKPFKDKYTNEMIQVGSVFECDDERAKNIIKLGYGEAIKEEKKKVEKVEEEIKDEEIPFVPESPIEEEVKVVEEKPKKTTKKKTTKKDK